MVRRIVCGGVVLAGLAGAAMAASPALRARVHQQWAAVCGWTKAAREADPVGFARYAERRLERDLEVMERTRRELAAEAGRLSRKIVEQQALAEHARRLAEEFRAQYQLASANGGFPVEVRGAAYTEGQAKAQISMLLAEADGCEQSVAELAKVRDEAETQMERLVVRVNATRVQLAALSARRELLRARRLTTEGEQLLAQVDELMTGNSQLIEGNPVRTVRELLAVSGPQPRSTASRQRVDAFLAARPASDADSPSAQQRRVRRRPAKAKRRPEPAAASRPIFRQS